jgi:desulfoferrodoxin (superoxide reductase-like protein)
MLEVPKLAEDPTAVPVRVSVDHPMERDHFIESVEVILDADPVPHKGTYRARVRSRAGDPTERARAQHPTQTWPCRDA